MKTLDYMSPECLAEIIGRFPSLRVAVIGDFFLDKYLDVDPSIADVSVESGKKAHQVVGVRHSPGAAGTVMINLAALETGELHAVGFTGDDGEAYELRSDLKSLGCSTAPLVCAPELMTMQYLKPRDMDDPSLAGEHERYDTKNRTPTPPQVERQVMEALDKILPSVDAVVVADQIEMDNCGMITETVREALAKRALKYPDVVFWADSRAHIGLFRNIIIKPNQFEVAGVPNLMPGDQVDAETLGAVMERLRGEVGAPVVATRGEKGMVVSDPELTAVPGVRLDCETDPTGAGDSVTAGCVLALAAGAELPEAALVGNMVASITVQQLATTGTARCEELPERLELWLSQQKESQ